LDREEGGKGNLLELFFGAEPIQKHQDYHQDESADPKPNISTVTGAVLNAFARCCGW